MESIITKAMRRFKDFTDRGNPLPQGNWEMFYLGQFRFFKIVCSEGRVLFTGSGGYGRGRCSGFLDKLRLRESSSPDSYVLFDSTHLPTLGLWVNHNNLPSGQYPREGEPYKIPRKESL